jgi:hypothetical protein
VLGSSGSRLLPKQVEREQGFWWSFWNPPSTALCLTFLPLSHPYRLQKQWAEDIEKLKAHVAAGWEVRTEKQNVERTIADALGSAR